MQVWYHDAICWDTKLYSLTVSTVSGALINALPWPSTILAWLATMYEHMYCMYNIYIQLYTHVF